MLTSLTVKCPQSKDGCNHLCAKRKEEGTQVLQEWDEMHFTEPDWGSGMRKKVNRSGKSISLLSQSWFIQVPRKLLKPTKEFPSSFPFFFLMRSEISWFTGQPPSFACTAFYLYILLNGRLYRAVFWGKGHSRRRVPSVRMLWRRMARKWILNE